MARSMLNLLIGKWSWSPAPTSTRIILCYGLNCSPSGNYLSFHTLWLSKTGEEPILLFNLGLRLLRSEIVIVNRRGHRVSVIQPLLESTRPDDAIPKVAWGIGDRLLVEKLVLGQTKGWYIYTPRGTLAGEFALDTGLASCKGWAISPDGRNLAYIVSANGKSSPNHLAIKALDVGRRVFKIPLDFPADNVVWSSGGRRLAAVGTEFLLIGDLVQPPGGKEQLTTYRMKRLSGGEIVLTDNHIFSVYDRGISILQVNNGEPVPVSEEELQYLVFAPQDKERFAAVQCDDTTRRSYELVVGEFANERLLFTRRMPVRGDITGICWSPDGSEVFYLTDNGQLRMWRAV